MQHVPYETQLTTQSVETAVQEVIELMRQRFNDELDKVGTAYRAVGSTTVNLPHIQPDRYYISEVIDPLQPPAVFVLADRSDTELEEAQQFEHESHQLLLVLMLEDAEITRLTRSIWRMKIAAYRTLHDRFYNNTHILIRGADYSPVYTRRGDPDARNFRKDVTLRLEVHTRESF